MTRKKSAANLNYLSFNILIKFDSWNQIERLPQNVNKSTKIYFIS